MVFILIQITMMIIRFVERNSHWMMSLMIPSILSCSLPNGSVVCPSVCLFVISIFVTRPEKTGLSASKILPHF